MAERTSDISPARGFMAEHGHYDDDVGFWEAHAERVGGPICDLGAAAGRVSVRLARQGHEVWAIDTDQEMLDVLCERAGRAGVRGRIHPVRASMTDPLPAQDVGLVLIPMNTLQLLRSEAEQVTCMRNAARALRPGGEIIFDLAVPHFDVVEDLVGELLDTGHAVDADTGDLLMHTAMFESLDRRNGEVRMRIMIDRIHRDGSRTRVERPHHLHMYEPDEIPRIAERAGLVVLEGSGGFGGEPLDAMSERHVWRLGRSA